MTILEVERIFKDVVIRVYNRNGEWLSTYNRDAEIDTFTWTRKQYVSKYKLQPMVKVYLTE